MAQQILVIGAGISGLATAVALQRRGHEVAVIEERTDTSSGAGISIWPNALAALDEIGLGDARRDASGRVTAGALRWRDGTVQTGVSARELVTTAVGVRITLSDSTTREAAAVIGADGIRSVVARHLN